jgi:hypothetical protein
MKRKWLLPALVCAVVLGNQTTRADDGFLVIPVPAGVGTKIKSVPYTINSPGFYYLAGNLSYDGTENAITVNANEVTLDLMGYNLISTGQGCCPCGVRMHGRSNVEIRNGSLTNFSFGIWEDDANGLGHVVSNIRTLGNYSGISLSGKNHKVVRCTASNNGSDGIFVNEGIVSGCTTQGGMNRGIDMVNGLIVNCHCNGNRICFQIYSGAAIGNVALDCADYGFLIGSSPLPLLMDQNSAVGGSANYSGGTPGSVVWGTNAGH